jgi:FkbM family methyltransferase
MRIAMLLKLFRIDMVLDIGANTGQFAESLYDFGYQGRIISFEPGKHAHEALIKRSKKYSNWEVYKRCAIGDKNGDIQINVSRNSVFSSILKITDDYAQKKKGASINHQETVPILRLDSIRDKFKLDKGDKVLLKIDTQGFEKQVLLGAQEILKDIVGLKIEIPLHPIYENVELTFYPAIQFLKEHGFEPYSFNVEGVDLKMGRVNTIDGLFFREIKV